MLLIWREGAGADIWVEAETTNYSDLLDTGFDWTQYRPAPSSCPRLAVNLLSKRDPPDFFSAGLLSIVSAELRAVLESFNIKAEFLNATIRKMGEPYTERAYFLLNLLDVVDCFDYDKSRYTEQRTPPGIGRIRRLVLDESKAAGHHLFIVGPRPESDHPCPLFHVIECASEELSTSVTESGVTGVVFTLPEDWNALPPPSWKDREGVINSARGTEKPSDSQHGVECASRPKKARGKKKRGK